MYRCSFETNDITIVSRKENEYTIKEFEQNTDFQTPDESIFEAYDHFIKHFKEDRFLIGHASGFTPMVLLNGMEKGLMEYHLNPELVRAAIQYNVSKQNYLDKYYLREGLDAAFIEQDFADSNGPLLSPDMFRDFCFPAMKERVGNIKKYMDNVFIHVCGNTWKLLDMFIEANIDCYQSLQSGIMGIKKLQKEYGDKLCFWGGVAVENLVSGNKEDVRQDVRYAMKHGSPDCGFILGPSHSIAYGTKYDNFMAMLDEYDKLKE